ncbi:hypothetical protein AK830_g3585 [Neonectria ditissima]|uniref:Uncharacterized protein n=1 Tax=Neonectria ditissima TaxID=78410 RepID=A0A0P7BBF6_9HYPO|nr:hypothetical protein AK830_g3585 [Neonectria ditissima]
MESLTQLPASWKPVSGLKRKPLLSDSTTELLQNDSQSTLLSPSTPGSTGDNNDISQTSRKAPFHSRVLSYLPSYLLQTWTMYCFLVLGIVVAIGHHLFYNSLHGKEAVNQSATLRYGTFLAFLAKANFGTTIVLAFRQRAWMTVRHKILSLQAVDSLFASINDISALFNWEAISKAKLAMCFAIYLWATPLIVILTSDTLSIISRTKQELGECPSIRTLNFSIEETFKWRHPIEENLSSLSTWNTTSGSSDLQPGEFDYWTGCNWDYASLADKAVYLQNVVTREDASREICGTGWNCSFVLEFTGPGYKCQGLSTGNVSTIGGLEAPFTTDDILPYGNYSYIAVADRGDYASQQIETGQRGVPVHGPPYPRNLGAFRNEPILWIGYASLNDLTKKPPINDTQEGWFDAFTPTIFGCENYEIQYTVEFNYTNGRQRHKVKNRQYLRKVIDTTMVPGALTDDGTFDKTTAFPESNYILPQDTRKYHRIGGYHSMGKYLRDLLNGTMVGVGGEKESKIKRTRLVENIHGVAWPVSRLEEEMRNFYEELMLSLLSDPRFITVSWAHDPSQYPTRKVGGAETNFPCIRERSTLLYDYNWAQLCTVYAAVAVVSIAAVISGAQATREEGVMRDMSVSSIIAATRAQSLNVVRLDSNEDTKRLNIGFGWVLERSGARTRGFGLEGDVTQDNPKKKDKSRSDMELGRYSGVEREMGD